MVKADIIMLGLQWVDRCDRCGLHGPNRDHVKAKRPTLVRDPHGPIHALFHQPMRGPDRIADLIEPPLMRDGEVVAQARVVLRQSIRSSSQCAGQGQCRSAAWDGWTVKRRV